MVIRSTDGITWEYVTSPIGAIRGQEPQIEIIGNILYYITHDPAKGVLFSVYNMDTKTWIAPITIEGGYSAKTAIINFENKLIAACNLNKPLTTSWGTLARNCMTFREVYYSDGMLSLKEIATRQSEFGIHYPCFIPYKGSLYMCYSEDKRKMNITQLRSNIGFVKLPF